MTFQRVDRANDLAQGLLWVKGLRGSDLEGWFRRGAARFGISVTGVRETKSLITKTIFFEVTGKSADLVKFMERFQEVVNEQNQPYTSL